MKKVQDRGMKGDKPIELRCPAWCRMFKRRDGTVPFDVSPIVPSPEQEVCIGIVARVHEDANRKGTRDRTEVWYMRPDRDVSTEATACRTSVTTMGAS